MQSSQAGGRAHPSSCYIHNRCAAEIQSFPSADPCDWLVESKMTMGDLTTDDVPPRAPNTTWRRIIASVLLFWVGYLVITLAAGFFTSKTIGSEVWQLTAWGFISSAGLLALSGYFLRIEKEDRANPFCLPRPSSMVRVVIGLLVGVASYGVHVFIVSAFAGPIRFRWPHPLRLVAGGRRHVVAVYFARFLSTSCMEEIGFRGYTLRRLTGKMGPWPAVCLTAVVFGLSHLSYGWSMQTIALGVVPGGLLWGMSAVATRGIAVPIGLHAAWNFAGWTAGDRAETGLLRMIVEEDALARTQVVGMASYLFVFGALTVAFWFVHRRNVTRDHLSSNTPRPKS